MIRFIVLPGFVRHMQLALQRHDLRGNVIRSTNGMTASLRKQVVAYILRNCFPPFKPSATPGFLF